MTVKILHITDSHIFNEPEGELGGVVTRTSLQKVLQLIERDHDDADLIVLGGDNTHETDEHAYRELKRMLEQLPIPYSFIPGNHDHNEPMEALGDDSGGMDKWLTLGNWNILLLDSHIEDRVPGLLAEEELVFADQMLGYSTGPVVAFVHHHLLPVGCAWLDQQVIANADELFNIANKHGCLKAVINGHVHQEWHGEQNGIQLYSTPSTCMQFKPDSDDYAEDDLGPGFRWILLHEDGRMETEVVRVDL